MQTQILNTFGVQPQGCTRTKSLVKLMKSDQTGGSLRREHFVEKPLRRGRNQQIHLVILSIGIRPNPGKHHPGKRNMELPNADFVENT